MENQQAMNLKPVPTKNLSGLKQILLTDGDSSNFGMLMLKTNVQTVALVIRIGVHVNILWYQTKQELCFLDTLSGVLRLRPSDLT